MDPNSKKSSALPAPGSSHSSSSTPSSPPKKKQRNAFTELMTPKPKYSSVVANSSGAATTTSPSRPNQGSAIERLKRSFPGKDGLGTYLKDPASYSNSRVIYFNDDFVAIHDMYPKSLVHTLLLPRSRSYNLKHPFDAFEDAAFLASVRAEALKLKALVAGELRRKLGSFSAADAGRNAVLDGSSEPPPLVEGAAAAAAAAPTTTATAANAALPPGRDWSLDVRVGVHAHPSMNHLHVHVMSRDMCGGGMKKKSHYLSFNTPFLVSLDDFPLAPDDPRRAGHLMRDRDLVCWRCGTVFGNKFENLKRHLAEEFEEWKKE